MEKPRTAPKALDRIQTHRQDTGDLPAQLPGTPLFQPSSLAVLLGSNIQAGNLHLGAHWNGFLLNSVVLLCCQAGSSVEIVACSPPHLHLWLTSRHPATRTVQPLRQKTSLRDEFGYDKFFPTMSIVGGGTEDGMKRRQISLSSRSENLGRASGKRYSSLVAISFRTDLRWVYFVCCHVTQRYGRSRNISELGFLTYLPEWPGGNHLVIAWLVCNQHSLTCLDQTSRSCSMSAQAI